MTPKENPRRQKQRKYHTVVVVFNYSNHTTDQELKLHQMPRQEFFIERLRHILWVINPIRQELKLRLHWTETGIQKYSSQLSKGDTRGMDKETRDIKICSRESHRESKRYNEYV